MAKGTGDASLTSPRGHQEGAALAPTKLAITIEETGDMLSMSTRAVRRLIALKELEVIRFGRSVRVTTASITALFERGGTAR